MNEVRIIGGGLAGLLVAQHLLDQRDVQISIADHTDPMAASNAPLAICHPFPGRSLKPHPLLDEAYTDVIHWMKRWKSWIPDHVYELPMKRPCGSAGGTRLIRSWEREWRGQNPKWGTIQYDQATQSLCYEPCFAVELGQLTTVWRSRLMARGVRWVSEAPKHWLSDTDSPVILCVGRNIQHWFPALNLTHEGGELATFQSGSRLEQLISGGGFHIGPLSEHHVVVGATRWVDKPDGTPTASLPTLRLAGHSLWPLIGASVGAWRGIRCIYPSDRLPLAGPIPNHPNLWMLGALGSKGLLWGPISAKHLVQNLCGEHTIPHALSTERIAPEALAFRLAD